jgi:phage gp36-like protein
MGYAAFPDLIARYDQRDILALITDDDHDPEAWEVGTDPPPKLQAALDDAAGMVDSSLMKGDRYKPIDLQGLTGTALSLLLRVNCDIAMSLLMQRRPDRDPERMKAQMELAEGHLRKLADGENVFAIPNPINAGLQSVVGPSCPDLENLNLPVSHCMPHYYPRRRLPSPITQQD